MKNILQNKTLRAFLLMALFFMLPITAFGQLLGWNTASNSGTFGVSPWTPQTLNSGVETSGLIRGATIATTGTPAGGTWGGSGNWSMNGTDSQSFHFTIKAKAGVKISLSAISSATRRSNSGPQSSKVYYSINGGAFVHLADWATTSTSGTTGTPNTTSLSAITALQDIAAGAVVKFRIVPQGTNGNYYITGGAEALRLEGNAQAVTQDPLITPSIASLPAFENITVGTSATPTSFTFNTVGLTEDVSISASTGFEISTDGNNWYAGTDITPNEAGGINNKLIWVRFSPTVEGAATGTITLTSTGADDKIITLSGNGVLPNAIAVSPTAITGLNYLLGQGPSAAVQLTSLTTAALYPTTGNLVLTPASGSASNYEVSTDGTTWGTTANYAYTAADNSIANPALYVRSKAGLPAGAIPQETINVQGGGMNFATFTVLGSVTTFPAPIATPATAIETASFTANWEGVQDATGYRLDVSTTPFATTANGFIAEDFDNVPALVDSGLGSETTFSMRSWTGTGALSWSGTSVRRNVNGFVPGNGQALTINKRGAFTTGILTSAVITGGTNKIAFHYKGASNEIGFANGRLMVRVLTGQDFTTAAFTQQVDYTGTSVFFEEDVTGVTGDYKIEISNIPTNTNTPPTGGGPLNIDNVTFNTITTNGADTFVPGFENLAVAGLSQTVTGLSPNTKYYYRVRAENGALLSVNSNVIEVTTACPPAPTVSAQTFCVSGTVADLLPAGLNWYDDATATTPLLETTALVSGTYFATQTTNGCETAKTEVAVTVSPQMVPDFAAITVCSGETAPIFELTSPNGITGTWAPETISNTTSGDYVFTPDASECATTQTLSVVVTEKIVPDFAAIAAFCSGTEAPVLEATSPNGITGTWAPETISNTTSGDYVFTPDASECATTQTLSVVVTEKTVPDFAAIAAFCSGTEAPALEATSPNGISGTWAPATISNTASGDYIFTPDASECATVQTLSVVVTEKTAPDFAPIAAFCSGTEAPLLEAISPNGITGTWTPAIINNTASGDYIFTPDASECATAQTLSVVVTEKTVPDFAPIAAFCSGTEAPVLEAISPNGITGTWTPETISNTASGDYVFTPDASECATVQTLSVVVTEKIVPDFAPIAAFCSGAATPVLEATSPNGITGTWTPATISNTASGDYIFTPDASECATTQTLSVVVTEKTVPDFAPIAAFCSGAAAPVLEATSPNGITGTWTPATISNTTSGDYLFTPDASECATAQTLTIAINSATSAPTGVETQDFNGGDTLSDFTVLGEGIKWYDAPTAGNELPSTDLIVTGAIYYASQTIVEGCGESPERLKIIAGVNLANVTFDSATFHYYPNPVHDFLSIDSVGTIDSIAVFNLLGQQLITKKVNSTHYRLDLSDLASGTYLIQASSGQNSKVFKVVKK